MKTKIIKKSDVKLGKYIEIYNDNKYGIKPESPQTFEEDKRDMLLKDLEKEVTGLY